MNLLLRCLAGCPLWLLHGWGWVVGWLVYAASPTYRRRLRANAASAGVPQCRVRESIAQAGKMVLELPYLWLRPDSDRLEGRVVRWAGREHVEAALAAGRGIVFLTPHLGCFEVTAQAYAEAFGARSPITVLYRPARQQALREVVEASRARAGLKTAPATLAGVRQMIRALKNGEVVGVLPDQVPPQGLGVWAPFFGQPAYTMTLAARLAQQTGAAVLLAWGERLPWGRGYRVHFEPLTESLGQPDDLAQSATVINRAMERLIMRCPQQYLWGYHRYKQPRDL
ncbi:lysophospholipid acyltransferase family protein [Aquabacterium sp.]|uniref:lysophospholipid acyltransferase family protein n=1 Tax=Aquabacterium sp. TaxID=1872578 RepID=UPI0035B0BE21